MIGATLAVGVWAAAIALLGLIVTTGLYVRLVIQVVLGAPPQAMPAVANLNRRELATVVPLVVLALLFGILPDLLMQIITSSAVVLAGGGG